MNTYLVEYSCSCGGTLTERITANSYVITNQNTVQFLVEEEESFVAAFFNVLSVSDVRYLAHICNDCLENGCHQE